MSLELLAAIGVPLIGGLCFIVWHGGGRLDWLPMVAGGTCITAMVGIEAFNMGVLAARQGVSETIFKRLSAGKGYYYQYQDFIDRTMGALIPNWVSTVLLLLAIFLLSLPWLIGEARKRQD